MLLVKRRKTSFAGSGAKESLGIGYTLSAAAGRISIALSPDEQAQRFKLTWTETGGPVVRKSTRRGFGTRLINGLADQLHGNGRLRYAPQGVVYELDLPLAALRGLAS